MEEEVIEGGVEVIEGEEAIEVKEDDYIVTRLIDERDVRSVEDLARDNPHKRKRTELTEREVFKHIYDRTFSLAFMSLCGYNTSNKSRNNSDNYGDFNVSFNFGTGWLLDYVKNSKSNHYKLFIATNVHVANELRYSGKFDPNNYQYGVENHSGLEEIFYIGKSIGASLDPTVANSEKTPTTYYTNIPDKNWDFSRKATHNYFIIEPDVLTKLIKQPKIIFAAIDFMKPEAEKIYSYPNLIKVLYEELTSPGSEVHKLREFQKNILGFKDFAILEFDYDEDLLNQLLSENSSNRKIVFELKRYRDWIRASLSEVDRVVSESKARNFTNKDNFSDNFYDIVDNATIEAYNNQLRFEGITEKLNGRDSIRYTEGQLKPTSTLLLAGYPNFLDLSKTRSLVKNMKFNWRQSNQKNT